MIIKIENLKLRTTVGIYDWEKEIKQDVIINVEMEFDGSKAIETDENGRELNAEEFLSEGR